MLDSRPFAKSDPGDGRLFVVAEVATRDAGGLTFTAHRRERSVRGVNRRKQGRSSPSH